MNVFHLLASTLSWSVCEQALWTRLVFPINNYFCRALLQWGRGQINTLVVWWLIGSSLTASTGLFHIIQHQLYHQINLFETILSRASGSQWRWEWERKRKKHKRESKQTNGKCTAAGPWSWRVSYWLSRQRCKTRSCGCVSIVDDNPGNVLLFCVAYDWVSGSEPLARAALFLRRSISIEQRLRQVKEAKLRGCVYPQIRRLHRRLSGISAQPEGECSVYKFKASKMSLAQMKETNCSVMKLCSSCTAQKLHKKERQLLTPHQNFLYIHYAAFVLSWSSFLRKRFNLKNSEATMIS